MTLSRRVSPWHETPFRHRKSDHRSDSPSMRSNLDTALDGLNHDRESEPAVLIYYIIVMGGLFRYAALRGDVAGNCAG
jgi:hypothetical protein